MPTALKSIALRGYRSIRDATSPPLSFGRLNVLIGANGAGKSNLLSFFRFLNALTGENLEVEVGRAGGAASILYGGPKISPTIAAEIVFESERGENRYDISLAHTADDRLIITRERVLFHAAENPEPFGVSLGAGRFESRLREAAQDAESAAGRTARFIRSSLQKWRYYHFHDTSAEARVKQSAATVDDVFLASDAGNLAPFLRRIQIEQPESYERIRRTIALAAPFFDDFVLEPEGRAASLRLRWRQRGLERTFGPEHLSDGTLRFICLATLLLQQKPPLLIVLDEPELGLHPFAIELLAEMFRSASHASQIVVATQSVTLLDAIAAPEDIIVSELIDGASRFRRLNFGELEEWLEDYSLGQLWLKNVLGGRPGQ